MVQEQNNSVPDRLQSHQESQNMAFISICKIRKKYLPNICFHFYFSPLPQTFRYHWKSILGLKNKITFQSQMKSYHRTGAIVEGTFTTWGWLRSIHCEGADFRQAPSERMSKFQADVISVVQNAVWTRFRSTVKSRVQIISPAHGPSKTINPGEAGGAKSRDAPAHTAGPASGRAQDSPPRAHSCRTSSSYY